MPDPDEQVDLEQNFSEIAVSLFAAGDVVSTLQHVVDLAQETVDGCVAAGILVIEADDQARTLASGRALAAELDRLQIDADEGPCLDAARGGVTFYADDLADDPRWPQFGPLAVAGGVRSVMAYAISSSHLSALNMYSDMPAAFGATDRAKGQLFATLARLALDSAESHAADAARTTGLIDALRTRELIGQAQGILMERERVTADQAFDVLRRASQHLNIKLREVASRLVETGESPDTGPQLHR